ncbi:unnamed protein product, partial [marine sediment metagenome]
IMDELKETDFMDLTWQESIGLLIDSQNEIIREINTINELNRLAINAANNNFLRTTK